MDMQSQLDHPACHVCYGRHCEILYVCTFAFVIRLALTMMNSIHHPFLLSDNRHYTFYVWHRIYMYHWLAQYLLVPAYLACAWAWYLRVGRLSFSLLKFG